MPEKGVHAMEHTEILRFEEIYRLVRIMTGLGLKHLRLTGGEPMARKGCLELAEGLRGIPGVESISMTSNGLLLKDRVHEAKLKGITSLNMSIDSLNPEVYARLTRGGDIRDALITLRRAYDEGLNVKVNAVPVRGYNEGDLVSLAGLAEKDSLCVRFIELMPFSEKGENEALRVTGDELLAKFPFLQPVESEEGTARYYQGDGFRGRVGFINPVSRKFCSECNRIRLLCDGRIKPCLGQEKTFDVLPFFHDEQRLCEEIKKIIFQKPAGHNFELKRQMHGLNQTGG
jgi:cyclic pyranopterin phosphate synthase